jgi:hypothetical protein
MRFYSWKLIGGFRYHWENHVFPEDCMGVDCFTALCGSRFGALNGEGKNKKYCQKCIELAPIVEEKAQEKERARIAKLELKRPLIIEKIVGHLSTMPIDELIYLLRSLKK